MSVFHPDQFTFLGPVAEGRLAVVEKLKHLPSSNLYAWKRTREPSPFCQQAIKDELGFLNRHPHPSIVKVLGQFDRGQEFGFLMEFLPGPSLQSECGHANRARLYHDILVMMEVAHFLFLCGYLYNDFKPGNFIRNHHGELVLVDFNLVKPLGAHVAKCGTLEYLAPEVIAGGNPTVASDIYSLGVTLYELITGQPPFSCSDQDRLIKLIAEAPPPPVDSGDPKLDKLITRMLTKNPMERPSGPMEICRELGLDEAFARRCADFCDYYLDAEPAAVADPSSWSIDRQLGRFLKVYAVPPEFADWVSTQTADEGSDIREYLRHLIMTGVLRIGDRGWHVVRSVNGVIIPPSLFQRWQTDLDGCTAEEREILQWLAVVDASAPVGVLAGLMKIDDGGLKGKLNHLQEIGWLTEREGEFNFRKRGAREVVYWLLASERRQRMHAVVADFCVATGWKGIDFAAGHYSRSDNQVAAFRYNHEVARKHFGEFRLTEAERFGQAAEEAWAKAGTGAIAAGEVYSLLLLLGDVAKGTGQLGTAASKYLAAARLAASIGDITGEATASKSLADVYRWQQKPEESIKHAVRALELFVDLGDLSGQAACYNNIGLAHWTAGRYQEALANFCRALGLNEKLGDLKEQAKLHSNIGIIYHTTGWADQVMPQFQMALDCARQAGDLVIQAHVLNNIGFVHLSAGRPKEALDYFHRGYRMAQETGLAEQLNIMHNMSKAYHQLGRYLKAAQLNQEALGLARQLGHDMYTAQTNHQLARDCLALGNFGLGLQALAEAAKIANDLGNHELAIEVALTETEFWIAIGDKQKAAQLLQEIRKKRGMTARQELQIDLLDLMAQERLTSAQVDLLESLARKASEMAMPDIAIEARLELARRHLKAGLPEEARRVLDSIPASQNTLLEMKRLLIDAAACLHLRQYQAALDKTRKVAQEGKQAGCLPVILEAVLLEARVMEMCGKKVLQQKAMDRARKLADNLISHLPEVAKTWSMPIVGLAGVPEVFPPKPGLP